MTAASANNIAQSQTPTAGPLTLNGTTVVGGVAVLDTQRQVLITLTGTGEAGKNFVITGTDQSGVVISETIAGGAAGTFASVKSYKTVTSITISANATNALTVGTNTTGDSPWQIVNWHATPVNISVAVVVTGTVTYTISYTYDDPSRTYPSPNDPPTAFDVSALAAKSTTLDAAITQPIVALRLRITSGTGTATLIWLQAGIV